MRWKSTALSGVIIVFLSACQAGPLTGAHRGTNPGSSAAEANRLRAVASRIAESLADSCSCPENAAIERLTPALCGYPIRVVNEALPHASTNGERIKITRGMLDYFASDDELAFVLAHEVSHLLLGHSGAFRGSAAKSRELEADLLGIHIVARAGFDAAEAAQFPLRLALAHPSLNAPHGSYPTPAERFAAIGKGIENTSWQSLESALGACSGRG